MASILLSWQNRANEAAVSGGSWQASLPLSNILNRQVQKVARSTNAAESSTAFVANLPAARSIDVVALIVHNLSTSARVRIRGIGSGGSLGQRLTSPNDFTNAAWTRQNVTVALNDAVAPTGATTAQRVTATTANSAYVEQAASPGPVFQYASSSLIYAKKGSGANDMNEVRLRNTTSGTDMLTFRLNYDTGAVTTIQTSNVANTVTVTADGDGWWRMEVTVYGNATSMPFGSAVQVRIGEWNAIPPAGAYAHFWTPMLLSDSGHQYASPYVKVWPDGTIPQDRLEWEEDNFWLGTLSRDARAGYQSPFIHVMPSTKVLTDIAVDIADSGSSDGYVQIGRLFMGRKWTPSVNYAYGAALQYEDPTPIEQSLTGAEYFDVRSRYRVFEFDLEYINTAEAYSSALDLQRLSGNNGEVLVVPDLDDATTMPARAFVGRLLTMGPIRQEKPSAHTVSLKLKELI